MINSMSIGKSMIIILRLGLTKKMFLYLIWAIFQEPYTCSINLIKIELDLSNYATKFDVEKKKFVDISNTAKEFDLDQ